MLSYLESVLELSNRDNEQQLRQSRRSLMPDLDRESIKTTEYKSSSNPFSTHNARVKLQSKSLIIFLGYVMLSKSMKFKL